MEPDSLYLEDMVIISNRQSDIQALKKILKEMNQPDEAFDHIKVCLHPTMEDIRGKIVIGKIKNPLLWGLAKEVWHMPSFN